jgi:Tannase and feruloyl esterase
VVLQRVFLLGSIAAAAALVTGCGGGDRITFTVAGDAGGGGEAIPESSAAACARLNGTVIARDQIGLPTTGATVANATLVAATATLPEYCQVTGAIAPVDPSAPPINFRVNLPSQWNEKAMHFGGGGYNGSVVAATGTAPAAPAGTTPPLGRGYATFGSDSGHTGGNAQFAVNGESMVNFGYAQLKKTRDVAMRLVSLRYGKNAQRTYWVGNSQGGREGLTVAQRFPADYDGVLVRVPVLSFTGLQLQGNRVAQALAQPGGWLNNAEIDTLQAAVVGACDMNDGLADGVISNYAACNFDAATLRCPDGTDTADTCLSDAQINTVRALHTPFNFGFAVANGVTQYQAWGWGSENNPANNWRTWVTGTAPAGGLIASLGNQFTQYFIAQNQPGFDPLTFQASQWQPRIQAVSQVVDSTNPDLAPFFARRGKLIIVEASGDYARSPNATLAYHDAVRARVGAATADANMRLYMTPGADHGNVGNTGWPATTTDWVALLEEWVERGAAPADKLTQVRNDAAAPFATNAIRPICRYPSYPRYIGGDVNSVASYNCVP